MTYTLRFLPEVEEDLINGYFWYEEKEKGLGEEFLLMFFDYANEIIDNPLIYRKVYGEFRRCLLKRFPYAIYFCCTKDEIIIFGILHCARSPISINSELQGRSDLM